MRARTRVPRRPALGGTTDRSGEQAAGVPVRPGGDPGQREEVAAAERADVVVQRVLDQPLLDGLELPQEVLLEAAEDQARVQGAVAQQPGVVVVAAAQNPAGGAVGA